MPGTRQDARRHCVRWWWTLLKSTTRYATRHICVLRIKPFVVPVDIQDTPYSCWFVHPREIQASWSQNYDTAMRRKAAKESEQQCDAMPTLYQVLDTTGTTCARQQPRYVERREEIYLEVTYMQSLMTATTGWYYVCVFFAWNRSFYSSTSSTPSARADSSS